MTDALDLVTALRSLGECLVNPDEDAIVAQVYLVDQIRSNLPNDPKKAEEILLGTLTALGLEMDGEQNQMSLSLVYSMLPSIIEGLTQHQPEISLPKPPNVKIGLLMLGEAIMLEKDPNQMFKHFVQPFAGTHDLSAELEVLNNTKDELEDLPKTHAEIVYNYLRPLLSPDSSSNPLDVGPYTNKVLKGQVRTDLKKQKRNSGKEIPEAIFMACIKKLGELIDYDEQEPMKEIAVLKKMFTICTEPDQNVCDNWYAMQLNDIAEKYDDDISILCAAMTAREYWEQIKNNRKL